MPRYEVLKKVFIRGKQFNNFLEKDIILSPGEFIDYNPATKEIAIEGVFAEIDLTKIIAAGKVGNPQPSPLFDGGAGATTYSPADSTDWSPVPSDTGSALDQVADRVKTTETDVAQALSDAAAANSNADSRVLKAGDTMTGALILNADPANNLEAATKQYVDAGDAPASGTTAARPVSPATGFMYFDTDINKPVWFNGTQYVDSTGTSA